MKRRTKRKSFSNIAVERAGGKGKSIGVAPDGKTLLITGAVPGDVVHVQTTKSRSKYYEAEVTEIVQESPDRIQPACSYFGLCGGCKWQHMSYEKQLYYKEKEVYDVLTRMAGISGFTYHSIVPSPKQFAYRNKMEFSFAHARWLTPEEIQSDIKIDHKEGLGFHVPGHWNKVLHIDECLLQSAPSNEIRNFIKEKAVALGVSFYDFREGSGMLRTVMFRHNQQGEWMLLFQLGETPNAFVCNLFDAVVEQFPEIVSLQYVVNTKLNDTYYDLEVTVYYGVEKIWEELNGLRFEIGPKSFFQVNYEQAEVLYKKAIEFAELKGNELVYDLYTGTGTIAQSVAKNHQGNIIGIESIEEAVSSAKRNAIENDIHNCEFYVGDMRDVFTPEWVLEKGKPNVILTDPPRDGMHPKVVQSIIDLEPDTIVYISCNVNTQARDIVLLQEKYKVVQAMAVDMFPQTHHVESIVVLHKM